MPNTQFDPEQAGNLKAILRGATIPDKQDGFEQNIQHAIERIREVLDEALTCFEIADFQDIPASQQRKEIKKLANQFSGLADLLENLTGSQRNAFQSIGMEVLIHTDIDTDYLPNNLKYIADKLCEHSEEIQRHLSTTEGYCLKVTVKKLGKIYLELTGRSPGYGQRKKYVDTEQDVVTKDDRFDGHFVGLVETCFPLIGIQKSNLAIGEIIRTALAEVKAQKQ